MVINEQFNPDQIYEELLKTYSSDLPNLNAKIRDLKNACIERSIDHSKYELRGEHKTSIKRKNPENAGERRVDEVEKSPLRSLISIEKIIESYKKQHNFLSYCLAKIEGEPGRSEKLTILYGKELTDHAATITYSPDKTFPLSKFKIGDLDARYTNIILVLFHASDQASQEQLNTILKTSQSATFFNLNDYLNKEETFWKRNKNDVYNETLSESKKLLIHDSICSERDCLLKSFFGNSVGFLKYEDLKGGLSGSKVLLITPTGNKGDTRKYVVKISPLIGSKLGVEFQNFKNFVEPYWVNNQQLTVDWAETTNYQAIRYPFASADTISDSISFSKKFRDTTDPESIKNLINKIFDHDLQTKWRNDTISVTKKFTDAFSNILNWPKTKSTLNVLLSPTFTKTAPFTIEQLIPLLDANMVYHECTNHGDFHSDNIQVQVDRDSVYLIDFGFTGTAPIGFDYAALEASIRFKLLDYSIDPSIMSDLDESPAIKFDCLINHNSKFNGDADKIHKCSSVIRQKFLNDFSGKVEIEELKKNYMRCLLAISLRQVNYDDMNRRYIIHFIRTLMDALT